MNQKQIYELKDPSHELLINLYKNQSQGNIQALDVTITGKLDGSATLTLSQDGTIRRSKKIEGDVHFNWPGDWYANSAVVRYKPDTVTKGHLKLEYEFKDM